MSKELCRSCGSCGFPMRTPEDRAGGSLDAEFCSSCAWPDGSLKPFDEVVEANAEYLVREQGIDPRAALGLSRDLLKAMPAWKKCT